MDKVIELKVAAIKGEARIDSRLIATQLGIQHQNLMETIRRHQSALEQFHQLLFETGVGKRRQGGGNPQIFALLTEDQAIFVMTLSRNTPRVVALKLRLVQAFSRFRESQQSERDYLPFYHDLHDEVKALAISAHEAGSTTPERIFHININKLINKVFEVDSGQRSALTPKQRVLISTANLVVRSALQEALDTGLDHKAAYQLAKQRLQAYAVGVLPTLADKSAGGRSAAEG